VRLSVGISAVQWARSSHVLVQHRGRRCSVTYPIIVLVVVMVIVLSVPKRYKRYVVPLFGALVGGGLGAAIGSVQAPDGSSGGVLACAAVGAVLVGALALVACH
jgi:hypothetical protein